MDTLTIIGLLKTAFDLADKVAAVYPELRSALSTEDQATLDEAYADITAKSKAITAKLAAEPDDPA